MLQIFHRMRECASCLGIMANKLACRCVDVLACQLNLNWSLGLNRKIIMTLLLLFKPNDQLGLNNYR